MQNSESYSAKNIFIKMGNVVSCLTTGIVSVIKDYPNNNPFGMEEDPFWWTSSQIEWSDNGLTIYEL